MITEDPPQIILPTPMTPETRKLAFDGVDGWRNTRFEADKYQYGNNWLGTAAYYKAAYSGIDDDQCKAFSPGVTPKQYRNILKRRRRERNNKLHVPDRDAIKAPAPRT